MSATKKRAGFAGDHPALGVVIAMCLLLATASSFGLSAFGLWLLAGEMGVEGAWRILLVLAIDGMIVGSTVAILVRRGRKESTWFLWLVVALFTAVSGWANFVSHRSAGQELDPSLVGGFMPVALLIATEVALLALVRTEDETPDRKPRRKRVVTAVVAEPAQASAVTAPATPKPVAKRTSPRLGTPSLDDLTGEAAELYADFSVLVRDPLSSAPGEISDRLSDVLYRLVADHDVRVSDLARAAGHANADKLRARVKKTRSTLAAV